MSKKPFSTNESITTNSYPTVNGLASDDDAPPGNIIFGTKTVKKKIKNRLTGGYINHEVVDNFKWDEFDSCKGMEDAENYSETLKNFNKFINRKGFNVWKHTNKNTDGELSTDKEKIIPKKTRKKLGDEEVESSEAPKTGEDGDKEIKLVNKHLKSIKK